MLPEPWQRLCSINEQPYQELVLDFYLSYTYTPVVNSSQPSISFHLSGQEQNISLSRFAMLLEVYPSNANRQAHLGSFVEVEDIQKNEVWSEITSQPIDDPRRCKTTNIMDSKIRILYRILTTTFWGRVESVANVRTRDLTLLYYFLRQRFMCLARNLAGAFPIMCGERRNQAILGGAFTTKLAMGL